MSADMPVHSGAESVTVEGITLPVNTWVRTPIADVTRLISVATANGYETKHL